MLVWRWCNCVQGGVFYYRPDSQGTPTRVIPGYQGCMAAHEETKLWQVCRLNCPYMIRVYMLNCLPYLYGRNGYIALKPCPSVHPSVHPSLTLCCRCFHIGDQRINIPRTRSRFMVLLSTSPLPNIEIRLICYPIFMKLPTWLQNHDTSDNFV